MNVLTSKQGKSRLSDISTLESFAWQCRKQNCSVLRVDFYNKLAILNWSYAFLSSPRFCHQMLLDTLTLLTSFVQWSLKMGFLQVHTPYAFTFGRLQLHGTLAKIISSLPYVNLYSTTYLVSKLLEALLSSSVPTCQFSQDHNDQEKGSLTFEFERCLVCCNQVGRLIKLCFLTPAHNHNGFRAGKLKLRTLPSLIIQFGSGNLKVL